MSLRSSRARANSPAPSSLSFSLRHAVFMGRDFVVDVLGIWLRCLCCRSNKMVAYSHTQRLNDSTHLSFQVQAPPRRRNTRHSCLFGQVSVSRTPARSLDFCLFARVEHILVFVLKLFINGGRSFIFPQKRRLSKKSKMKLANHDRLKKGHLQSLASEKAIIPTTTHTLSRSNRHSAFMASLHQ